MNNFILAINKKEYNIYAAINALDDGEINSIMIKDILNSDCLNHKIDYEYEVGDNLLIYVKGEEVIAEVTVVETGINYTLSQNKFEDIKYWSNGCFEQACKQCGYRFIKVCLKRISRNKSFVDTMFLRNMNIEPNSYRIPFKINNNLEKEITSKFR